MCRILFLMEQHIFFQKHPQGYCVDYIPPLDSQGDLFEGKPYTVSFMSLDCVEDGMRQIHEFLEKGLFEGIESVVIEGAGELSSNDDRLLEIFCKVCRDDFKKNIRYEKQLLN